MRWLLRLLVAATTLLLGVAVSLCTVALHGYWWGLALALLATAATLVALPGGGGKGAALSLLAAVAVTAGTLLARRLGPIDVVVATGWHLLIGGIALAGAAGAIEGAPAIAWTPRFIGSLSFLAVVGTAATNAKTVSDQAQLNSDTLTMTQQQYQSSTGVDLDEEIANLQVLQNAYSASARLLSVIQTLYDTLQQAVTH